MYKVMVRDNQFFSDSYTIGDVIKFYAERADLKTESADFLFYCMKSNDREVIKGIITKRMSDSFINNKVSLEALAKDYVDENYPMIYETQVEEFLKEKCQKDTPVLNASGIPVYVILKGYIKTSRSEHYICKVLAGLAPYDLSVNADMTVSCNCMLRSGGKLGDLREQTLAEIYSSEDVSMMRKDLLNGYLPTVSCYMRCNELVQVPKSYATYFLKHYTVPRVIMYESVSACNLKCTGCFNQYIERKKTTIEDTIKFAEECKKEGIDTVHMFKYGEPFIDTEIGEKIDIIREYNPEIKIIISTNGVLLDVGNNMENALKVNRLIFSLDGIDDETVLGFQKNSQFDRVYDNMCRLVQLRNKANVDSLSIVWKYVLFEHNDSDEMIDKVFEMAQYAGVDSIEFFIGFNTDHASPAIWKSDVFLKYMEKYKFDFKYGRYVFWLN